VTMLGFINLETRIPHDHPLCTLRRFADEALAALSPTFDERCTPWRLAHPSHPNAPGGLAADRCTPSAVSGPSCEQLEYNELFRWTAR
jgi:hypothetical protein